MGGAKLEVFGKYLNSQIIKEDFFFKGIPILVKGVSAKTAPPQTFEKL